MDNPTLIMTIIISLVGWGFSIWGVVSYLIDRMDKKMQVEREERLKSVDDINARIERIKETHVLREDFHRFVDRLEGQISEMTKGINGRMDMLFTAISGTVASHLNTKKE